MGETIVTDTDTLTAGQEFARRDLLKKGLIGSGVVAAALVAPGLTGTARGSEGKTIALDIDTDGFAGVSSDEPRAVVGGTGNISNARGQGLPDLDLFDFNNSGKFRISFSFTGASGSRIG